MAVKDRSVEGQLQYEEISHQLVLDAEEIARVFDDPLYSELLGSVAFQRLRSIRFLGAIDFLIHPNGRPLHIRHTRFQHSLGVGRLALRFSIDMGWEKTRERTFVSAALLHDLGHGPLSHSLERQFKEYFGIDHHIATIEAITMSPAGGASILQSLKTFGVDPEEVIDMISNRAGPWSPFFLGRFNVDTLDAITRSATYLQRNSYHSPPYTQ